MINEVLAASGTVHKTTPRIFAVISTKKYLLVIQVYYGFLRWTNGFALDFLAFRKMLSSTRCTNPER